MLFQRNDNSHADGQSGKNGEEQRYAGMCKRGFSTDKEGVV
ncbi:MAG: hypothetical protein V2B20_11920 [Pseudomonadota bacterium]